MDIGVHNRFAKRNIGVIGLTLFVYTFGHPCEWGMAIYLETEHYYVYFMLS